jgi:rhamnosyltransferase subunit B
MAPKRILFCNEFGAGRGHHTLLQSLSSQLQGIFPEMESRFVLPPHSLANTKATPSNWVFAPELKVLAAPGATADRYLVHGICKLWLQTEAALQARLRLWQSEIAAFKPDLIIADYAPSLSMVAHGKVPCFVVGSGYTLPPPEQELCLAMGHMHKPEDEKTDEEWLEKLNSVLRQENLRALDFLPQVNRGDAYGLFTIPLFDTYWQDRQQNYFGVHHPGGSPVPTLENDGSALVYMSLPHHGLRVVDGLIESQIPTIAYLGPPDSSVRDRVHGTSVVLADAPFELPRDLPGRALAVHTGSLGMSAAGVYAGIPQVGLYQHDEGMGNCRSFDIAQIGVSAWVETATPQQIADMMQKAKASTVMRGYAQALSQRYRNFRDGDAITNAMPTMMSLLG